LIYCSIGDGLNDIKHLIFKEISITRAKLALRIKKDVDGKEWREFCHAEARGSEMLDGTVYMRCEGKQTELNFYVSTRFAREMEIIGYERICPRNGVRLEQNYGILEFCCIFCRGK